MSSDVRKLYRTRPSTIGIFGEKGRFARNERDDTPGDPQKGRDDWRILQDEKSQDLALYFRREGEFVA